VQWRYEAVTLGLEWGSDGSMTKAFCPDFYLPEPQSFVEITVAEPRRFVRKMAKVKRARELYPEIHIALVGLRELDALCSKHGITVPFDRAA
jgi:hypothetical protein